MGNYTKNSTAFENLHNLNDEEPARQVADQLAEGAFCYMLLHLMEEKYQSQFDFIDSCYMNWKILTQKSETTEKPH